MARASTQPWSEVQALLLRYSGSCSEGLLMHLCLRLWSTLRAYGLSVSAMRDERQADRSRY